MAAQRHLTRAPIEEALIDIQVRHPAGFEVAVLETVGKQWNDRYPKSKKLYSIEGRFGIEDGQPINEVIRERTLDGFVFLTEDERTLVQMRQNGFTLNRLRPYTSWDELFPEAQRLWQQYFDASHPLEITRLAVRYINRIDIPDRIESLADYLEAPPVVPLGTPKMVSEFLTRIVVHDPDAAASANVVQVLEKGVDPNSVPIILDIDAYKHGSFDVADLVEAFESLHELKNRIFFAHITELTARLFE